MNVFSIPATPRGVCVANSGWRVSLSSELQSKPRQAIYRQIVARSTPFRHGDLDRAKVVWDSELGRRIKPTPANHWSRKKDAKEHEPLPEAIEEDDDP